MGGIYLLLGTNLGDRLSNLNEAMRRIENVLRSSSVYSTAAWGVEEQPEFFNQVIEIESKLKPEDLLKKLLAIEIEMGRERLQKWGPRLIDIDILFYKDEILNGNDLVVPHPEIQNRRFTLIPMLELNDKVHPLLKKKMSELLEECEDSLPVKRLPLQH